ncbi:hypothetical protein EYF80_064712 [Liparis tanakae]|uniref:Uncharacterized protein n=1 Tax=Liparis tanakae TaxID=230148 RepID=A0A4Z2E9B0_9TELE|nr:hypothetical protein EYF80_064712 [Liparis tanakae]
MFSSVSNKHFADSCDLDFLSKLTGSGDRGLQAAPSQGEMISKATEISPAPSEPRPL